MKILTDSEINFTLEYYAKILSNTKSSDITINCRYYRRMLLTLQMNPWMNIDELEYVNNYEKSNQLSRP